MNTDISLCSGVGCAKRKQCLRYHAGVKALEDKVFPVWWLEPKPKCEFFLKLK